MAYGLEPKRIFWWVHQQDGQTRLSWVTIKRVDHWHGRIAFDFNGELQETDFSQLELSLFRRYPLWNPERECYLADHAVGWEEPPKPAYQPAGQAQSYDRKNRVSPGNDLERGADRQRSRYQPHSGQGDRSRQSGSRQERDPGQVRLKGGMRLWYLSEDRKSCSMITVQQVFPASQEMTVVTGGNTLKLALSSVGERLSVGCPHKADDGLYAPDRTYIFQLEGRATR